MAPLRIFASHAKFWSPAQMKFVVYKKNPFIELP